MIIVWFKLAYTQIKKTDIILQQFCNCSRRWDRPQDKSLTRTNILQINKLQFFLLDKLVKYVCGRKFERKKTFILTKYKLQAIVQTLQ